MGNVPLVNVLDGSHDLLKDVPGFVDLDFIAKGLEVLKQCLPFEVFGDDVDLGYHRSTELCV